MTQQQEQKLAQKLAEWQAWLAENKKLNDKILQRNGGQPIDVDRIWGASRADLAERHDWLLNNVRHRTKNRAYSGKKR